MYQSTCEHHLVAIKGSDIIAYQPQNHIVGLKKINQNLHFFAERPQLQERLTRQVFIVLQHLLQSENIALIIKAQHDCINNLNVTNDATWHFSSQFGGIFNSDKNLKQHILQRI